MPSMSDIASTPPPSETKQRGHRILLCLDRSTFSEACVPYAVWLAKTFGSSITLVYVMQPSCEHPATPTTDALGWELARQEARAYLERIEKDVALALGRPVDVRVEQGRPAHRIIDLAREIEADLTVVGCRGEGGSPAPNLGSTTQQVLALARRSLFIAHAAAPANTVTPKRILVPLDGSLRTESALPAAARIASTHGAEILLVHVVQEPLPTALLTSDEAIQVARNLAELLESGATRYLDRLKSQLEHEVKAVRTRVVRDANARQRLVTISQEEQSDLIVLSAHGSACDSGRSFGSVTAYLLTHATVPLLVLQDLPEQEVRDEHADAKVSPTSLRASYASETV